jgi:hypothetical protein
VPEGDSTDTGSVSDNALQEVTADGGIANSEGRVDIPFITTSGMVVNVNDAQNETIFVFIYW